MTLEELQYLVKEACDSYGCGHITIDDLPEQMEEVEDDGWEDDGKYSYKVSIFKCDQGNHFQIQNTRSGSYFTDYNYGEPYVTQVKPVLTTITKVIWKAV